jgi:dihydropteroate synthase
MSLLKIGNKDFELLKRTIVMGILNVTPDSFSDGGKFFSVDDAVKQAIRMEKEGADIIDIGGESTRPGSDPISIDVELNRVLPVIEAVKKKVKIPISIDTYKSKVAKEALDLGCSMVNDISALRGDEELVKVVVDYNVPICLMHMKGEPKNMQLNPTYEDVVAEICDFLIERAEFAISSGVREDKIIIDPGLGFGKRTGNGIEDNCEILRRLYEFKELGFPILIGTSRKTFIGNICGKGSSLPTSARLEGSLAAACIAVANGADIVRVHDVEETRRCVDIIDCISGE